VQALSIDALRDLLRAPVEVYWRQRLNVQLDEPAEALDEDEPFSLDGLDSYTLRKKLVDTLMLNTAADAMHTQRLRGLLPLAAQGDQLAAQLKADAQVLLNHIDELRERYTRVLDPIACTVTLDGQLLQYTLDQVRADQQGNRLRMHVRPAKLYDNEGRNLKLDTLPTYWFDHVLACAAGEPTRTVVVALDQLMHRPAMPKRSLGTAESVAHLLA
jgi:exodeoxyribonuclease V gamma subunit